MNDSLRTYLDGIKREFQQTGAREHAYRPALKGLLESVSTGIHAVNDPAKMFGDKPDFTVLRSQVLIGTVEAKDINSNLDKVERSDQMKRYLQNMPNLLLTNNLEFRWYVEGQPRETITIGTLQKGNIHVDETALPKLWRVLEEFVTEVTPTITTAEDLARLMAKKARSIALLIIENLEGDTPSATLQNQMNSFKERLIPSLSIAEFADMYAQTMTYGLFAARLTWDGVGVFDRQQAYWQLMPKTNPLLTQFFRQIGGPELDPQPVLWYVEHLVEVMRHTETEAILAGFGKRSGQQNQIIHFYETFLREYDARTREQRGVYYTPQPVVDYIVRSVDELLKTRFQRPQGLADPNTYILDPATGTGTFLHSTIQQIHATVTKNNQGMWLEYVKKNLLKRLFGFELLIAPYTIAHFNLARLLQDLGYIFGEQERLGIYLTNALEQGVRGAGQLGLAGFIEQEATQAAEIKESKPIMVVLGNPPYSGHSANNQPAMREAIRPYYQVDGKPLGERNPKWLQDDYVKFIHFGQQRILKTGEGILAFITNHGFLDNPTFRGMRQHLLNTFSTIYILDLHGNSRKKEVSPDGSPDQNVFEIQQGVSIAIFIKEKGQPTPAQVLHAELWGNRASKFEALARDEVNFTPLQPDSPFYLFTPQNIDLRAEYDGFWGITDIMPTNVLGFQTHRDPFAIDIEREVMLKRIQDMRDPNLSDADFAAKYNLADNRDWKISRARATLKGQKDWESYLIQCAYRPFDLRYCYFSEVTMDYPRRELVKHVFRRENLIFGLGRQGLAVNDDEWHLISVATNPVDANIFRRGGINLFPLYEYPDEGKFNLNTSAWVAGPQGRVPNLNPKFVAAMEKALGLPFQPHPVGAHSSAPVQSAFTPEDIFHYAYAVFHSPTYRARYAEFLKIDFPRLPLTTDQALFWELVKQGQRLVALHLMQAVGENTVSYPQAGDHVVAAGYPKYEGGKVYINREQYFEGIPAEVWEFHIGGYQVLDKWLKDRKGRALSYEDITHYQHIVAALGETMQLMNDIDELIPTFPLP